MNSQYNPRKSFSIFFIFLLLGIFDLALSFYHITLLGVLDLPFWGFFLPVCFWEFYFLGKNYFSEQNFTNAYQFSLLFALLVLGFFLRWGFFLWAIAVECSLLRQMISGRSLTNPKLQNDNEFSHKRGKKNRHHGIF